MKVIRDKTGTFKNRVWFDDGEIDRIMECELHTARLYPTKNNPEVDVEAYIENRLHLVPEARRLPEGVLGATRFEDARPVAIYVDRNVLDAANDDRTAERRLRTTLAHEGPGHAFLHPVLFDDPRQIGLFGDRNSNHDQMCREIAPVASGYSGEWWEYQANQAIGGFLLPKTLFIELVDAAVAPQGRQALQNPFTRHRVESNLSRAFNVSMEAVRYRIDNLDLAPPRGQQAVGGAFE